MKAVYVTRDTSGCILVWPVHVGIRKFHGCVMYGAAWREDNYVDRLSSRKNAKRAECLSGDMCCKKYGFCPRVGTAWHINSRGKRKQVFLAFSP
ncbi:MAG: hypothetical protein ACYSSI_00220 [Planctomycetota bacterium]